MTNAPLTIAGLSRDEILHEAIVAPKDAIVPLPDTVITERPGFWQLMTPSIKTGGMNEVIATKLPAGREDQVIDETLAAYAACGVLFRWTVLPWSEPADLGERLARRGLSPRGSLVMARATAGAELVLEEGVTVDEVGLADVDVFTQVMAEGWEMDPGPLDALHRAMLSSPKGCYRFFVARYRGEPGAAAAYTALPRSAYMLGAVAIPRLRGKGLYRAVVLARLLHARSNGIGLATSQANEDTSAPILRRLGFEEVARLTSYSSGHD